MQPLYLKQALKALEEAERILRSASKNDPAALKVADDLYALGVLLAGDAVGDTDGDFFLVLVVH